MLRAAMTLADEGGIEALTMRRLGRELGVEAMSLYGHLANKDDLLDGILDLALSEIELPVAVGGWKAALRRSAISAHEVFRRHPWSCGLALSPARRSPAAVRRAEWMLRELRDDGFPAELAYHAYHALDSQITGFTLWELGHSITQEDVPDLVGAFFREFASDEYPYLTEHAQQHLSGFGREAKPAFEFVLDLILDGLETLRDAAPDP